MILNLRFTLILPFLAFFGCASGGKSVPEAAEITRVLPTAADYSVPDAADYNVDITLVSEAIDSRLMVLQEIPQVTFTVWGFDELAADVSATEIKVSSFDLRPQAVPYQLRFSDSELQSIEYQSGTSDHLKYYVTIGVDVDRDGKVCNGDLRQDYSLSPPERFLVSQNDIARTIQLSEIKGEICTE